MAYRDTEHDDHSHGHVSYIAVFLALCIFTGISVLADIVTLPNAGVKAVVVMAVAVAKATCVMLFFMHLKFEGNWKYILLAPTTILAIGLPIALMPDVATSYYISDVPQKHDYEEFMAHHGHHDEEHGEGEHAEGAHDEHGDQDHHGEEHERGHADEHGKEGGQGDAEQKPESSEE